MTLQQLLYFQAVAEYGNFHKASAALHVAQPSLSVSVSNLEKELGILLFERKHHQTTLTEQGLIFYNQVSPALDQINQSIEYMHRIANVNQGSIKLAYIPPMPPDFIPNCVHTYLQLHPDYDVRFSFSQAPTRYLLSALQSHTFDIIFCTQREDMPDVEFRPIMTQNLVAIVPYGHPLAKYDEISIMQLKPYDYIMYAETSGIRHHLMKYFDNVGFKPNIKYESTSEESIASLVKNNFGVSAVIHTSSLDNCGVRLIRVAPIFTRTICMAYLKDGYSIPSVRSFIKYMQNNWCL